MEFIGFTDFFNIDELIPKDYYYSTYDGVTIIGPGDFTSKTLEALKYVKENDKEKYNYVKTNITKIKMWGFSGVNVLFKSVGIDERTYKADLRWYSSVLIHEACHINLFDRLIWGYIWVRGENAERICMEKQNEFFSKIGYPLLDIEEILKTKHWKKVFSPFD